MMLQRTADIPGGTMTHDLHDTIALLERTPVALSSLLHDLAPTWTRRNEGTDTWDPTGILGHLVYCERTEWLPRVKIILDFGESKTFEPFDRWGFQREKEMSMTEGLDEFARLRKENLDVLRQLNLQPHDLAKRGTHPTFGSVTLSQLLATWAAHDLTHMHQITRVMAHQYRETVGPWSAYLGVMHCDGHSTLK